MKPSQIIRLSQLLAFCDEAGLVKEATLENDMAKRVMLSVIPSLADPAANQYYGGFPDYKALKLAVQGADRIVKYAAQACVKEMMYYGEGWEATDLPYEKIQERLDQGKAQAGKIKQAFNAGNYELVLTDCAECFLDKEYWVNAYGGEPWSKIASTAFKLLNLRNAQKQLDESRKSASRLERQMYDEQEISIMKEIVIYLNVFDGLAHNTGSIFEKMIEHEHHDLFPTLKPRDRMSQIDQANSRVKKLMDTKELDNAIDVYKNIEDTLQGSGEHLPYKDWMSKARRHPDYQSYHKREDEVKKQYEQIAMRKTLISHIGEFKKVVKKYEDLKERLIKDRDIKLDPSEINSLVGLSSSVDYTLDAIANQCAFLEREDVKKELMPIKRSAFSIADDFSGYMRLGDYTESMNCLSKLLPLLRKSIDIATSF
jgi:tetratricopeptide (TPR) repeat protein